MSEHHSDADWDDPETENEDEDEDDETGAQSEDPTSPTRGFKNLDDLEEFDEEADR